MSVYLTCEDFADLTIMPKSYAHDVENRFPGWIDKQIEHHARWLDSRLRKRYESPFAARDDTPPTPPTIQLWITRMITPRVWLKRGVDANDLQFEVINQDALDAKEEIAEAANSEDGLFDLPVRTDQDGSAINRGGPRVYSEQSPYVGLDMQRQIGRCEDESGGGSYG